MLTKFSELLLMCNFRLRRARHRSRGTICSKTSGLNTFYEGQLEYKAKLIDEAVELFGYHKTLPQDKSSLMFS